MAFRGFHFLSHYWTQTLFPNAARPPASSTGWLPGFTVAAAAAVLFFGRLGTPLQEPEEARYAEVPRQMLAEGSLLVPVLHGQPYYDKPPLLYWLVLAAYQLFGVHDWAARLVPSAAGFLTVVVTYYWGRATRGGVVAVAGALILCLAGRYVYLSRLVTMNGVLALWVVAALAAAHGAILGPRVRWRWWLASAVACSLGLLTKGPVALVLVAVPVLAVQCLDTRLARPRLGAWLVYGAVAAGLSGPWFVYMALKDPDFVSYFFWRHHVVRYAAPFDHAKPFWFYVPQVVLGLLPGALLLPWLFGSLCRRGEQRPAALGLYLAAAAWCLVFYSLAGSKRPGYILPVLPPLALALGCTLEALWVRRPQARRLWLTGGVVTFAALGAAVYLALPGFARRYSLRGYVRPHAPGAADLPVFSYPRRWDSVSFYLGRGDVRAFTAGQREAMLAEIGRLPRVLLFIKAEKAEVVQEILDNLPATVEFVPHGRQGALAVGVVQRAEEAANPLTPRVPHSVCGTDYTGSIPTSFLGSFSGHRIGSQATTSSRPGSRKRTSR